MSLCGSDRGGNAMCARGECCSADGRCGKGPEFCWGGGAGSRRPYAAFDGAAGVTCDPGIAPSRKAACDKARAIPSGPPVCGPAHNTLCPWRKGVDLCCVQDVSAPAGYGRCIRCDSMNRDDNRYGNKQLVWSPGSGWSS